MPSWQRYTPTPVSYTHLDVYKRQAFLRADRRAGGGSGLRSAGWPYFTLRHQLLDAGFKRYPPVSIHPGGGGIIYHEAAHVKNLFTAETGPRAAVEDTGGRCRVEDRLRVFNTSAAFGQKTVCDQQAPGCRPAGLNYKSGRLLIVKD